VDPSPPPDVKFSADGFDLTHSGKIDLTVLPCKPRWSEGFRFHGSPEGLPNVDRRLRLMGQVSFFAFSQTFRS
jgi:hypothetical protein